MAHINIRPARPEDTTLILRFVRELAEFERALAEVTLFLHVFTLELPPVFGKKNVSPLLTLERQ